MNTLLDGKPMNPGQGPGSPPHATGAAPSGGPSGGTISLIISVVALLLLGYVAYDLFSAKGTLKKATDTLAAVEKKVESNDTRIMNMSADFSVVKERLGITQRELDAARAQAAVLQRQQEQSAKELQAQLSKKAEAGEVKRLKEETSSKIGEVTGDVTNVKADVAQTKKDLESTRRELLDVRETLSSQIAHNASELSDLRRKGERNYFEFELDKRQNFKKVADLALRLSKVDVKKKKYTITVSVDDNTLEKKDKTVDEPVQFLVGKNRLRYEIVINQVGRNTATGYLSTPKDVKLGSENPRSSQ